MKESVDYQLIRGFRIIPLFRRYKLLKSVARPNGKNVPIGYQWDGGTGVPMFEASKSAYAFLCHDAAYGEQDMAREEADRECVRLLGNSAGVYYAAFIGVMFALLKPTLIFAFITRRGRLRNLFFAVVLSLNLLGLLFMVWGFSWII